MGLLKAVGTAVAGGYSLAKRLDKAEEIRKQTGLPFGDAYSLTNAYGILETINSLDPVMREKSNAQLRAYTADFRERIANCASLDDILPEAYAVVREVARRIYGNNGEVVEGSTRADPERCREVFGEGESPKFGMHYDVQILGGIALHEGDVAEMYTGEGKTLAATLPAYLNALTEEGVHVVTVNDYLAKRDAQWMSPLFNFLGISVGVVHEDEDGKKAQVYKPGKTKNKASRKDAYNCDITYGTTHHFVFDYLRDNTAKSSDERVQRGHNYVIIDEVDNLLIDEARTPFIISATVKTTEEEEELIHIADHVARLLIDEQTELTGSMLGRIEYDKRFETSPNFYDVDLKKQSIAIGEEGYEWLEKHLNQLGFGKYDDKDIRLIHFITTALKAHTLFHRDSEYQIAREKEPTGLEKIADMVAALLIDEQEKIDKKGKGPRLYTLNQQNKSAYAEEAGLQQIKSIGGLDGEKHADLVALVNSALRACTMCNGNKGDEKVVIVDKNTGRPMPSRRWSEGLHEAIEAKEGASIKGRTVNKAAITMPFYFAKYRKKAGMTGTAKTDVKEFRETYGMDVVSIPTNKRVRREDYTDVMCGTEDIKLESVVDEIAAWHSIGRPVLVGTTSVERTKIIAEKLRKRGINEFEVLNAEKEHIGREAEIVAMAGQKGAITIATNMAGRGTDIALGEGVGKIGYGWTYDPIEGELVKVDDNESEGGLVVIGTERHEARRIDNQLRGRAGRQGDPGTTRFYTSPDDRLLLFLRPGTAENLRKLLGKGMVESGSVNKAIRFAQSVVGENHRAQRKYLFEHDIVLGRQRDTVYGLRDKIIEGDGIRDTMFGVLNDAIGQIAENAAEEANGIIAGNPLEGYILYRDMPEKILDSGFREWYMQTYDIKLEESDGVRKQELQDFLLEKAVSSLFGYDVRVPTLHEGNGLVDDLCRQIQEEYLSMAKDFGTKFDSMEHRFLLEDMDRYWVEHLTGLDWLKEGIWMRAYAQKDPRVEYLRESSMMFRTLMHESCGLTMATLMHSPKLKGIIDELKNKKDVRDYLFGAFEGIVGSIAEAAGGKAKALVQSDEIAEIVNRIRFTEWYAQRFEKQINPADVTEADLRDFLLENEINNMFDCSVSVPAGKDNAIEDICSQLKESYSGIADDFGDDVFKAVERRTLINTLTGFWGDYLESLKSILESALTRGFTEENPRLGYLTDPDKLFDEFVLKASQQTIMSLMRVPRLTPNSKAV